MRIRIVISRFWNVISIAVITNSILACDHTGTATPKWEPELYDISTFYAEESAYNGKRYWVSVVVPKEYDDSDKPYPVFYTLDGNGLTLGLAKIIEEKNKRLILVGIHNMGDENRAEDNGLPGIVYFTKFVTRELAPIIEERYNIDSENRTILGQSWTGVGVTYMAFLEPVEERYFRTYISADGAFINEVLVSIDRIAKSLEERTDTMSARIIIRSAQYGLYKAGRDLYDQISGYSFSDYYVSYYRVPDVWHGGTIVEAVFRKYIEKYDELPENQRSPE